MPASIFLFLILMCLMQGVPAKPQPTNLIFALTTDGEMIVVEADGTITDHAIHDDITGIVWSSATGAFATTDLSGSVTLYPAEGEPFLIVERGLLFLGDWSADGRFLLVIVAEHDIPYIRAYDMLNNRFATAAALPSMAFAPYTARWSPDGATIYFDSGGISLNALSAACLIDGDAVCETRALYFYDGSGLNEPENAFLPTVSPKGDQLAFVCGAQLVLCIGDLETYQISARIETGQVAVGHGAGLAPRWIGEALYYVRQGTLHRYDLRTDQETPLLPVLPLDAVPNYWFWGHIAADDSTAALAQIKMAIAPSSP